MQQNISKFFQKKFSEEHMSILWKAIQLPQQNYSFSFLSIPLARIYYPCPRGDWFLFILLYSIAFLFSLFLSLSAFSSSRHPERQQFCRDYVSLMISKLGIVLHQSKRRLDFFCHGQTKLQYYKNTVCPFGTASY